MGSVMIVRADRLQDAPLSFQMWVEDFFVKEIVLDVSCWVAQCHCYHPHDSNNWFKEGSGIAPSHSGELSRYEREFPDDPSISSWIYSDEAKESGIFHTFHVSERSRV